MRTTVSDLASILDTQALPQRLGAKNAPSWVWLTTFSHPKGWAGRMRSQVRNANTTAGLLAAHQVAWHGFEQMAVFSHLSVFAVVPVSSSKCVT